MTGWVEVAYSHFCLENFLELYLVYLRPVFPCHPQGLAVVGGNLRGQFAHCFGEFRHLFHQPFVQILAGELVAEELVFLLVAFQFLLVLFLPDGVDDNRLFRLVYFVCRNSLLEKITIFIFSNNGLNT